VSAGTMHPIGSEPQAVAAEKSHKNTWREGLRADADSSVDLDEE